MGSKGRKPTTIQHFIVQLRLCELQTTHHSGWLLQQHGLQLRLRGRGKKVRMCLGSTDLKGTNSIRCSPAMYASIKDLRIKTWIFFTGAWLNQAHGVVGLPVHKNVRAINCHVFPTLMYQLDRNELVLLPLSNSCHQRIRIPCPKWHISIMFHKIFQKSYLSFVQLSF